MTSRCAAHPSLRSRFSGLGACYHCPTCDLSPFLSPSYPGHCRRAHFHHRAMSGLTFMRIHRRWTSFPSVSYWAPMMSGVFMGLSAIWIFVCFYSASHPSAGHSLASLFSSRYSTTLLVRVQCIVSYHYLSFSFSDGIHITDNEQMYTYSQLPPRWPQIQSSGVQQAPAFL